MKTPTPPPRPCDSDCSARSGRPCRPERQSAVTDDKTPVMIDVLANDHGSDGVPMILEGVGATDCPGTATSHPDGTVGIRSGYGAGHDPVPAPIRGGNRRCAVYRQGGFDDRIHRRPGRSRSAAPRSPDRAPGRLRRLQHRSAEPSEQRPRHLLLARAAACHRRPDRSQLDSIDALKTGGQAPNQRLLCRAADYYSQIVRPPGAGFGQPDSGAWFLTISRAWRKRAGWTTAGARSVKAATGGATRSCLRSTEPARGGLHRGAGTGAERGRRRAGQQTRKPGCAPTG